MDDETLVDEIARHWIAAGGDSEGFAWLQCKIRERIEELLNDTRFEEVIENGG